MAMKRMPLNPREQEFIERYAQDPTQVRQDLYREVFQLPKAVTNKQARERACRLLKKPQAQEYLAELRAGAAEKAQFGINDAAKMFLEAYEMAKEQAGNHSPNAITRAGQALCELYGLGAKYAQPGDDQARNAVVLLPARTDNATFQELADAWLAEAEERQQEMMQYVTDRTH